MSDENINDDILSEIFRHEKREKLNPLTTSAINL